MHCENGGGGGDDDDDEPVRERWDDSDRDPSSTGLRSSLGSSFQIRGEAWLFYTVMSCVSTRWRYSPVLSSSLWLVYTDDYWLNGCTIIVSLLYLASYFSFRCQKSRGISSYQLIIHIQTRITISFNCSRKFLTILGTKINSTKKRYAFHIKFWRSEEIRSIKKTRKSL